MPTENCSNSYGILCVLLSICVQCDHSFHCEKKRNIFKMDGRTKGYVNWLSLPQNNPTTKPDQDVPIQESDFARKTTKKMQDSHIGVQRRTYLQKKCQNR